MNPRLPVPSLLNALVLALATGSAIAQGSSEAVIAVGDPLPGLPGVTINATSNSDLPVLDQNGTILVRARLAGGVTGTDDRSYIVGREHGEMPGAVPSPWPVSPTPFTAEPSPNLADDASLLATIRNLRSSDPEIAFDEPGDGLVWARGRDYKACVSNRSFTFVPFLGSDAPCNYPVSFSLRAATSGSESIPTTETAVVSRDANVISMHHGSITVTYDFLPQGVEQKFLFGSVPTGQDLVVTLAVNTDLTPHRVPHLRFANQLGGVDYGQAIAVDAAGKRMPIASTYATGELTLRVPAFWLSTAQQPILIDPLIQRTVVTPSLQGTEYQSDIAWRGASPNRCLVAVVSAWSQTDHDIEGVLLANSGGIYSQMSRTWYDVSTDMWREVAVAGANNSFLVAAEHVPASRPGLNPVVKHRVVGPGGLPGPWIQTSTYGASQSRPDIGGVPDITASVAPSFCVVMQAGSLPSMAIIGRYIDSAGNQVGGDLIIRQAGPFANPSISKQCGRGAPANTRAWGVVWQEEFVVGDPNIEHAFISPAASSGIVKVASLLMNGLGNPERHPSISSPTFSINGDRFWMACASAYGPPPVQSLDIVGVLLRNLWGIQWANLSQLEGHANRNYPQSDPHVDSDGIRFAIGYSETAPQPNGDPFGAIVSALDVRNWGGNAGVGFTERHVAISSSQGVLTGVRMAAAPGGFLGQRGGYGATWCNGGTDAILGSYDGVSAGSVIRFATGCGGLGITSSGRAALGETIGLGLTGVGGNIPLIALGSNVGYYSPWFCPPASGCSLGMLDVMDSVVTASATLSIPPDGAFLGVSIGVQGYAAGVGPCGGVYSMSDTLRFTVQ